MTARLVSALAVAGLLLAGCSRGEASGIATETVGRATVREVVEAPGAVGAKASATVVSPASGKVGSLSVREGQRVKAGQVLLRIDSPQAREQLAQAREADSRAAAVGSGVGVPRASLSGSRGSLDRAATKAFATARSSAQQVPDPQARAQAVAAVDAARAQYVAASRQAQATMDSFNAGLRSLGRAVSSVSQAQRVQTRSALALAERAVAALVVRAPISGVVSLGAASGGGTASALPGGLSSLPSSVQEQAGGLLAEGRGAAGGGALAVGSPVSSGATLLTLTDTSTLTLSAEVDETDVLLVKPGVKADVELDAVPGARYAATVGSVDVTPTTSARGGVSYVVRLTLGGGTADDGRPAPQPRPGMSAVVDLQVRTARNVVAVPVSAVFRDGKRDAVWVIGDGVARKRVVRLGAQGDEVVHVVQGLRLGEQIVVRGADRVTEGRALPAGQ